MGCFVSVEGGKHYTYSFNAKTETSNYIYISVVISGSLDHDINGIFGRFVFIEGSEYKQYSIYIDPEEYCELYIGVEHRSNVVGKTWVYGEKLECGINQYPFWTPNPTDVYTE